MTVIGASFNANTELPAILPLIDTHTHFDAPVFDIDRDEQIQQAYQQGIRHLVLVGYLQRHFQRLSIVYCRSSRYAATAPFKGAYCPRFTSFLY